MTENSELSVSPEGKPFLPTPFWYYIRFNDQSQDTINVLQAESFIRISITILSIETIKRKQ